jgi:quinoprotein glucose dehydrogenase
VARLTRAWTFSVGEPDRPLEGGRADGEQAPFEGTPLVIDGVMYLTTSSNRLIALDPDDGTKLWEFDPQAGRRQRIYLQNRGASFWQSQDGKKKRLLFGTVDGRLYSVNAVTGKPSPGFGREGWVDLRAGVADRWPKAIYNVTSPPAIYRDLVITGARLSGETPDGAGPSGEVRAFDVHTGKLVWTFHTIPRPEEPGHETWTSDSWRDRSGANAWSILSVDQARGLVFVPTAQPLGSSRPPGSNLYANCLIALEASTGTRRWHYQMVHHDLWDYDIPAQPNLVTIARDGRAVDAVAQVTKMGLLFVLERETGKPVFPVEERAVSAAGPDAWPTQPIPLKPEPLARLSFARDELSRVTEESFRECSELFASSRYEGMYTPPGKDNTILFPGTLGGANWSGSSFDAKSGRLFVNVQNLGNVRGRGRFWDRNRWPCQQPPWGSLVAVDLNRGEIAWSVTLGVVDELTAKGVAPTGTPNLGGTIVTAGGLVFIAATNDKRFRAFDSDTGKELWSDRLEANGHATPISYTGKSGRQFIAIAAGGGGSFTQDVADVLAVYALPR